jgi:hypothetical protein
VHYLPRSRSAPVFCLALLLVHASCTAEAAGPTSSPPDGDDRPDAGAGASLSGRRPFPDDNPWNLDISGAPVDPASSVLIAACGVRNLHPDFGTVWNGAPIGIPYVVVSGTGEGPGELRL